jgi:DNA-binding XRE family transcriptional regulator
LEDDVYVLEVKTVHSDSSTRTRSWLALALALALEFELEAANIRRARLALGWSQEALAHEAGLHRTFIRHVERGETNLSIDNIERLANALKIPASDLLVASPEPAPLLVAS